MISNRRLNQIVTELYIMCCLYVNQLYSNIYIYYIYILYIIYIIYIYIYILQYQKLLNLTMHIFLCYENSKQTRGIVSDIDFKEFMNLYKKCTGKSYSFMIIDTTLASDNPLRFRINLLERI